MRFMTTVILALVLVAVALLIYFQGSDTDSGPTGASPLFPGLSPDAIQHLELSMFRSRKAVLEKRAGNVWHMTMPFKDQARIEIARRIIDALTRNQRITIPLEAKERDLASKGLDPPKYYIRFEDDRGSHTLFIGARDPFQSETFVMIEGDDHLYRTGANLLNIMELNPEDMRDERIFRLDSLLVNGVVIEGPDGLVMEAEKKSGYWDIVAPIRVPSSSGKIQNLVARLTSLQSASRLYDGPLDDEKRRQFGLGESDFEITLRAGPISHSVTIGSKNAGPNASHLCQRNDEDAILCINGPDLTSFLFKPLAFYRSRELLKPVREVVQNLKIWKGNELRLELERLPEGKYFKISEPFQASADNVSDGNTTPVYNFLIQVDGIRIEEFVANHVEDLSVYGLEPPDLAVDLQWKSGGLRRKARLVFSADDGQGFVHAARVDEPGLSSVFRIKSKDLEPLRQDALYLRDRRIFPQDVGEIQGATFTDRNLQTYTIRRDEGGFFAKDPQSRFQQFLNQMTREQVVRYMAGPDLRDSPYFLKKSGAIEIVLKAGNAAPGTKLSIVFGAQCDEGWYGKISDQEHGIFIISDEFMQGFNKLFVNL